jgi:hypothetical protein
MGRALFPFGNHMRVSVISGDTRCTRDKPLNVPQLLELLSVLKDCPPERRLIISGFRREGQRIVRRAQKHPLRPTRELPRQKKRVAQVQVYSDLSDDEYYNT